MNEGKRPTLSLQRLIKKELLRFMSLGEDDRIFFFKHSTVKCGEKTRIIDLLFRYIERG